MYVSEIAEMTATWPKIKVVISTATPLKDNLNIYFTNSQIINTLLKQRFNDANNTSIIDHRNMLSEGNPNEEIIRDDHFHLNEQGASILVNNIKRSLHNMLGDLRVTPEIPGLNCADVITVVVVDMDDTTVDS
jgi:lysophospholipase L1-like esterase